MELPGGETFSVVFSRSARRTTITSVMHGWTDRRTDRIVVHTVIYRACTGCGIKTTPKKTYISHEQHNLNYSNLQRLLPRYSLSTSGSENSIHIFRRKQKLHLSILKSAILQLNTRYYCDCYTENANKTNCIKLI